MQPTNITRRSFLRLSAAIVCGGLVAGCTRFNSPAIPTDTPQNYYQNHRQDILKNVKQIFVYVEKVGAELYDAPTAAALVSNSLQSFDALIPDLPYIGGSSNELTSNLYQSAAALALFREMKVRGHTAEETGKLLYFGIKRQLAAAPVAGITGQLAFTQMAQDQFKNEAMLSQKRTYPADWVFEYIAGDGQTFDYGIDYTECGICKYYRAQNASEFVPYMCLLDYPVSEVMKSGLARTTTLGRDGTRCDFRYKAGRPVQVDWTPDFLKAER
jgi:hypothetical protein